MISDQKNLVIIDARTRRAYAKGHIPGAISIPSEETFDQKGDKTRVIRQNDLRNMLSGLGVKNQDHLFIYDSGIMKDAAHVFWAMEVYGHTRTSVLDGGLPAWVRLGGKLTRKIVAKPASNYLPNVSPHRLATKLMTRLAIETPGVVVLDARTEQEYLGKKSKAARKGHIPGAINIPAGKNLDKKSGVLKSVMELNKLYTGIGEKSKVVTYCNRGRDSSLSYLTLRNLGYSVSVYDGAWLEWGNDLKLPIEPDN